MSPVQQFRVRDKLLRILQTAGAGAKEKLFTTRQIATYLGKYIEKKNLHDSGNMRIVRCKGDFLEELFGVQEFAIDSFNDLWQFIFPHIIPATNKEVLEHESRCHNKDADTSMGLNDSTAGKMDYQWMSQLPWWFFVEKEPKGDANIDAATASGSIVATSTVYVVDTDYESDSNDSRDARRDPFEEDRFSVEYEPDSESTDSDATEPFISDDEDKYLPAPFPRSEYSEDTTTTDTTETDVSVDFDIPLEDHWRCAVCKEVNSPTVGYCQRCWKLRKGWVNDSLSGKEIVKSQTLPAAGQFSEYFIPSLLRSSSQPKPCGRGIDVSDGKINLQEGKDLPFPRSDSNFMELPFNNPTKRKHDTTEDISVSPSAKKKTPKEFSSADPPSTSKLCETFAMPSTTSSPSVLTSSSESVRVHEEFSSSSSSMRTQQNSFPGLCNICHNNPNDATIVHGNIGHQFCCCKCAKKLKKKGKTCPVCRQPIVLVVKTYFYQM